MLHKYNMSGECKKYISLLGDSVYEEKLGNEIEFTNLLPKQMREFVLQ